MVQWWFLLSVYGTWVQLRAGMAKLKKGGSKVNVYMQRLVQERFVLSRWTEAHVTELSVGPSVIGVTKGDKELRKGAD